MINYITLLTAILISVVAAYFSIIGLVSIFAAAMVPVAIMASILEVGKLVTVSWLYNYWDIAPRILKAYLLSAIFVLMFITSLGIFGFLSKAHIDQTLATSNNDIEIALIDNQIENIKRSISDKENVVGQLDSIVKALIDARRIRGKGGSVAIRKLQEPDRIALTNDIEYDIMVLQKLRVDKSVLAKEQIVFEAEIGPIKYIAELFYGNEAPKFVLEKSVRWIILIIILAFDPLAVIMLLAANIGFAKKNRNTSSILKQMAGQLKNKGVKL